MVSESIAQNNRNGWQHVEQYFHAGLCGDYLSLRWLIRIKTNRKYRLGRISHAQTQREFVLVFQECRKWNSSKIWKTLFSVIWRNKCAGKGLRQDFPRRVRAYFVTLRLNCLEWLTNTFAVYKISMFAQSKDSFRSRPIWEGFLEMVFL